jgi:hypothetical protein
MMPLSIVDPEQWKLPDPQRMLEILQSLRSKIAPVAQKSSMWIFSSAIAPVDLYAFLKSRFGPPNGFQMLLRSPSVDNLIHWNYTLECPESILDLLGMNTRMEAHAWSADLASSDWRVLEANLQRAFQRSKDQIRATQETFERWSLFINPYQRLSAVVERYAQRLRDIKIPLTKSPPVPATPDQMERFRKEMETAMNVYHEATALCVSLEMIAPVMGEAAINLFTLILGKPEIRNDERFREDFIRGPIDIRIKTLHLVCEGFAQPVRGTEQAFKDFLRIMNRRNG